MKALLLLLSSLIVVSTFAGQKTVPNLNGKASGSVTNTYAASQVDTVFFTREAGWNALSFGVYFSGAASVTNAIVRRVVNGVLQAAVAGDTLFSSFAPSGSDVKVAKVTLEPLVERYAVIVTYAGSGQQPGDPTVKYIVNASYGK